MLNYVYLLSRYLIEINEKCQVDSKSKRVEFGTYLFFGTRLESTHTLSRSTHTKRTEKNKNWILVLRSLSRLRHGIG